MFGRDEADPLDDDAGAPTPRRGSLHRIPLLTGPGPTLPPALDRASEWWASQPPRIRLVVVLAAVLLTLFVDQRRVASERERWGGPPEPVLVADSDLGIGEAARGLRRVLVPPSLVPPDAVTRPPRGATLTSLLPAGAILTRRHLDPSGPGAGLAPELRAVPVTVEEGWQVTAGGWVDVWVLDSRGESRLVGRGRPVLDVRGELPATALVGMTEPEVEAATRGLAGERLLLTHAPAPARGTVAGGPEADDEAETGESPTGVQGVDDAGADTLPP